MSISFTCPKCKQTAELTESNRTLNVPNTPPTNVMIILCKRCVTLTVLDLNSGLYFPATEEILKQQNPDVLINIAMQLIPVMVDRMIQTRKAEKSASKN